ncbi:derlin-2.2-like isoform X2 [Gastrolobium bilobum]|uniref:derlin-2.2-like isoform X2 n=1 Tax=Gastrolobium bilobum TaxID=150636 RepID=UPI002AB253E6|nr:derlin-2.2-like isoform X2 [Gastrolobium bilobum]
MMVYVWSKRNPFIHMSFLGLFTFTAAYLPWLSGKFNLEGNIELQVGVSSSAPGSGYSLLVAQMEPKIIRTELLELLFMKDPSLKSKLMILLHKPLSSLYFMKLRISGYG